MKVSGFTVNNRFLVNVDSESGSFPVWAVEEINRGSNNKVEPFQAGQTVLQVRMQQCPQEILEDKEQSF